MGLQKVLKKHLDGQFDRHLTTATVEQADVTGRVMAFIQSEDFPCVGAKAALVQGNIDFGIYGTLTTDACETSLHLDLREYITELDVEGPTVQSFAAIFLDTPPLSEADFETLLWTRLKGLSSIDEKLKQGWSEDASADPKDAHFSMSLAGHPFFVVGMHPNASRLARRAPYTMLVFNSTIQFNHLREDGRFEKLQKIIRERDLALQGSINPNLSNFGEASDASQYSGRPVNADWQCPVHFKSATSEPEQ